jgi:hypothetical protein
LCIARPARARRAVGAAGTQAHDNRGRTQAKARKNQAVVAAAQEVLVATAAHHRAEAADTAMVHPSTEEVKHQRDGNGEEAWFWFGREVSVQLSHLYHGVNVQLPPEGEDARRVDKIKRQGHHFARGVVVGVALGEPKEPLTVAQQVELVHKAERPPRANELWAPLPRLLYI